MSSTAALLKQRAHGHVKLHMRQSGVEHIREVGSSKVRLPPASGQAYLINTAGGLAGGDAFSNEILIGKNSALTITTQAAERVYRSLGPPATVENNIKVEADASLHWLPHETILFDGASLNRCNNIELNSGSRFLGLEATIFGRKASGENITSIFFREEWRIKLDGKLIHSDIIKLETELPSSKATLENNRAIATLILIDATANIDLDQLRNAIGVQAGVSMWNGKLVARLIAKDGMTLKKALVSALSVLASPTELPKTWAL
jgi:urease accessory protein